MAGMEKIKEMKIAVFGAGGRGKKNLKILYDSLGLSAAVVLDNKSYGYTLYGIRVLRAEAFLSMPQAAEYHYIVGGAYSAPMYSQLLNAGIARDRIDTLAGFLIRQTAFKQTMFRWKEKNADKPLLLFDCMSGLVMGGVENWSLTVGKAMEDRGYPIRLFTAVEGKTPETFRKNILFFPLASDGYGDIYGNIGRLTEAFGEFGEVTFIIAHINFLACMAMILKRIFPDRIRVISVIHSSLSEAVLENLLLEKYFDAFFCVNHEVMLCLKNRLTDGDKVHFMETPVPADQVERTYHTSKEQPVHIGYAARLEAEHKRSDLIPALAERLEKLHCHYALHIAGDGRCFAEIEDFVKKKGLGGKVKLYGEIPHEHMYQFWRAQDIAVNVSETEGCALSMLEAMACGCVPVVTDTPGTDWFVRDGENGCLTAVGDMERMAGRLCDLEACRERLPQMGQAARRTVAEKCGMERYMDRFESLLTELWGR